MKNNWKFSVQISFLIIFILKQSNYSQCFELIGRECFGNTRAVCVNGTGTDFYTISGMSLLHYRRNGEKIELQKYLDHKKNCIYSIQYYESENSIYLYVAEQNQLLTYKDQASHFEQKNKLLFSHALNIDCGYKDILLIDENRLFIVKTDRIDIYSIALPTQPALVDSILIERKTSIAVIDSHYLFVGSYDNQWRTMLSVYDKDNLQLLNKIEIPNDYYEEWDFATPYIYNISRYNKRLIVALPLKLYEIDLSDISNPIVHEPDITYHEIESYLCMYDNYLFLYDSENQNINIYDVEFPQQYELINTIYSINQVWSAFNWEMDPILMTAGSYGIRNYDISCINYIESISSTYPTCNYLQDVDVHSNTIYVTDYTVGLLKIDKHNLSSISYLSNPIIKSNKFILNPLMPDIGYIATLNGNISVIDTDDPKVVNTLSHDEYIQGNNFQIYSNTGYFMIIHYKQDSLLVYDLSQPQNPMHIYALPLPGFPHTLAVKDSIAYLSVSTIRDGSDNDGALMTLDLSNPHMPVILDTLIVEEYSVESVAIKDSYAFLLTFHYGFLIIDISDPYDLKFIKKCEIARGREIKIQGNYMYISGMGKVSLIDIHDPIEPLLINEEELFGGGYFLERSNIAENLVIINDTLYVAGGASGLYIYKVDTTYSNVENLNYFPQNTALHQNFPNPFNHNTKITFTIKKSGFTELNIYDILGRKITTLLEGFVESGYYEYSFDSQNLPSGVYYYRLKNKDEYQTRKLVLIK